MRQIAFNNIQMLETYQNANKFGLVPSRKEQRLPRDCHLNCIIRGILLYTIII